MSLETRKRVQEIRSRLDHPVVDSDGHCIEYLPAVRDRVRELAGESVLGRLENVFQSGAVSRRMPDEKRRELGMMRMPFWGLPARNTRDRATAMLPELLYERLPELGLDFAVVYPTYALVALHLDEDEVRQAACRAFNEYMAEAYRPYADRIAPVATIPMQTPQEALAELDHAVGTLGLRVCMLGGFAMRPVPGADVRGARWIDTFGRDSAFDYDPVWARCVELGIAPTFHSTGMGWGSRASLHSYVHNHIGNFAAAGEATCRGLFLDGVPWRFPELRFAFLEGGVGWAANLYADLIGHWEKRNREHISHYDPANLDRDELRSLFERHAPKLIAERLDRLDESLAFLSDPEEDRSSVDEFARCRIESADDIRQVFERFHFGCEADDPINALAFDARKSPGGLRLKAIFSSDIGHWDVPDMNEVLLEAWELVEQGLVSEEDFRDFTFANPVSLWRGAREDFFAGTAIEREVAEIPG